MAGSDRLKSWVSTTTWGSAPWQLTLTAFIAALLFFAVPSADAAVGLDPSWESALALARAQNLAWGPEIVFTAGPLGYLHNPVNYYSGQSVAATVYQLIVLMALFLGIAAALRQRFNPMTSLIVAFVTTGIANFLIASLYPDLAVLAAFAWASVLLLQSEPARSTVFVTCVTLGAVAGFQLLVKINSGPTILVIALTVSVLLGWRTFLRHFAILAAFAASTVLSWLLAGQQLELLPTWLRLSGDVASGYVDGMSVVLGAVAIPTVALTLTWLAAVCFVLVQRGIDVPRRFVFFTALVSLMVAKTALGRFDAGHVFIFLALVVVVLAITPHISTRHVAVIGTAVTLLFLSLIGPGVGDRVLAAVLAPVHAVDRLVTLGAPGAMDDSIEQSKERQRTNYAIPARFVETIGKRTVHVDPSEASVVWSYNFAWHPAPVFQTYSAYTPVLDKLNEATLKDGPQYVLSHVSASKPATGIDGRLGTQESPLYSRALLCDYALKGIENHWALFERTRPHCGPLTRLSEVLARDNDTVTVPAPTGPGNAVLVGIDLNANLFDRLFQGAAAPLTAFTVAIDGVGYRLVSDNAAEPFLVNNPESARGTNLEIRARTIGVGRHTSIGNHSASARLRFYEMAVGP